MIRNKEDKGKVEDEGSQYLRAITDAGFGRNSGYERA
jgi:hypothetical protein